MSITPLPHAFRVEVWRPRVSPSLPESIEDGAQHLVGVTVERVEGDVGEQQGVPVDHDRATPLAHPRS